MRTAALFTIFILAIGANAFENSNWFPQKNYKPTKEIEKAFKIGQAYYANKISGSKELVDYQYNAYIFKELYVVVITPMYRVKGGGYQVAVDGEQCIYLNKSFQVKSARQCISPISDLLAN